MVSLERDELRSDLERTAIQQLADAERQLEAARGQADQLAQAERQLEAARGQADQLRAEMQEELAAARLDVEQAEDRCKKAALAHAAVAGKVRG